jgi:SAM-dependent methyltransferase
VRSGGLPADWYRTSFAPDFYALFWEEGGEEKAELALAILKPDEGDRFLDLACATGRRTLELSRRGFNVYGIDVRACLLEVAAAGACEEDLWPHFKEKDPRYMDFRHEFDVVLSLGGGAFEHFDYDEENLRAFEAAARSLRLGGRLLMQVPNVIYVEEHLPPRTWIDGSRALDVIEQHWDEATRRLNVTRKSMLEEEHYDDQMTEVVTLQRRLYSVEELAEIFESVGLMLRNVYDEHGAPCTPSDAQAEIYVEAQRWTLGPEADGPSD